MWAVQGGLKGVKPPPPPCRSVAVPCCLFAFLAINGVAHQLAATQGWGTSRRRPQQVPDGRNRHYSRHGAMGFRQATRAEWECKAALVQSEQEPRVDSAFGVDIDFAPTGQAIS